MIDDIRQLLEGLNNADSIVQFLGYLAIGLLTFWFLKVFLTWLWTKRLYILTSFTHVFPLSAVLFLQKTGLSNEPINFMTQFPIEVMGMQIAYTLLIGLAYGQSKSGGPNSPHFAIMILGVAGLICSVFLLDFFLSDVPLFAAY